MTAPDEPRGAVARHDQWRTTHLAERNDLWCIRIGHPGYARSGGLFSAAVSTAPLCRPTMIVRWGPAGDGGAVDKRGACLGCTWEGPTRRSPNDAVEDAHDHAWPSWRSLLAVRELRTSSYDPEAVRRWRLQVASAYPPGWLESGGPIVVLRRNPDDRMHRAGKAPGGGYEIAAAPDPREESSGEAMQGTLPGL
ncbi:DUF6349 family protein [Planomonospora alba]